MMRNLFFICVLFSINHLVILCQQPDYVRGKVLDSKTSKPVPFATVRLKNSQIGVLTNSEGDFMILNSPRFQSDSLIISCIGFRKTALAYSRLKTPGMNVLKLVPYMYNLNEVTVTARRRRISSEVIISRALRNIKKNSPDTAFSYVSYYRDYQKNGSNYLNLNEAIIQTFDNGFASASNSNKYRLLDFKRNMDFLRLNMTPYYDLPATSHSDKSYKKIPRAVIGDQNGNELFILLVHDAIRNFDNRSFSFIDTLTKNFLGNHRFSDPIGIHDGNTLLYKIDFSAKQQITGDSIRMKGSIFIQPDDYSIHKLEYSGSFLVSEQKFKEIFNIKIEYDREPEVNSRMCLKYISFSNSFTIPDSTDKDFFKIDRLEWSEANGPYAYYPVKAPNMTIKTTFNRNIDPILGGRMDNYELTIGARKAKITKVWITGNKLYLVVRDDKFKPKEIDSCNLSIKYLKDTNGNILNKQREIEFNQFRELFVQEYNKTLDYQDDCFVQSLALEKNCISISDSSGRYWMNTPLKAEETQQFSPVTSLDSLVNQLNDKLVTVENVYIETDRNNYLAEDTIWFTAFVIDNFYMDSTSVSKILHVDLINPDNKIEDHLKLLINNGRAKGDFTLNKDVETGLYRLRAYTQYMRNYQGEFLFEKDIPVYQSDFNKHILIDPIIKKSIAGDSVELFIRTVLPDEYKSLGKKLEVFVKLNDTMSVTKTFNFNKVLNESMSLFVPYAIHCSSAEIKMTLSGEKVISTHIRSLRLNSDIMLQFFPESGKLIDGIETVVAYKAVDRAGNSKEFEADITDENQNLITHITADMHGIGKFIFTPERNHIYKASYSLAGNKYVFNMPDIEPKGYVLNYDPNSGKILIKNNHPLDKGRHYLLVSVRGMVYDSHELLIDSGTYELYQPFETYPKGIVQITLYDSLFRPQAERLVFNNRSDQKMLINVESDKRDYLKKEKVNLTINVKDMDGNPVESSLSLSVVDASKSDSLLNLPDIESYLFVTSELKGRVDYRILNLSDTTDEGKTKRDLVMMTQGWRNFLWNSIRYNNTLKTSYPVEKGLFIDGTLINYDKRKANDYYTINFLDFNSGFNGIVRPDETQKFEIESPLFYDSHAFFIQSRDENNKRRTVNVGIKIDTLPLPDINYRDNELLYFSNGTGIQNTGNEKFTLNDSVYATDIKYISLPEVKINARSNLPFSSPDAAIDLSKKDPTGKKFSSLFQMIYEEFGEKAFSAIGYDTKGKAFNPILVVNGYPYTASNCPPCYSDDYDMATSIPVNEVMEAKFYTAGSKFSQWLTPVTPPPTAANVKRKRDAVGNELFILPPDPQIYLPVVSIKTYSSSYRGNPRGAVVLPFQGIYQVREFYQPVYENNINKMPDNRITIYWNPEIKIDSTGKAKISFINSDLKGKALIKVSGVSYTLKEASSSHTYYLSH